MSSNFEHKIPFLNRSELSKRDASDQPLVDIAVLIIAAGSSSRLGSAKQLIPFNEKPLLAHIIEEALFAKLTSVSVVLGSKKELILPKISHLPVSIVLNENWEKGMGGSIATGVKHILDRQPSVSGILVLLCDQPFVSAAFIRHLGDIFSSKNTDLVASTYSGNVGVPAVFGQSLFTDLKALKGKGGAKKIILKNLSQGLTIPFAAGVFDIDTPADVARIEEWKAILDKKNKYSSDQWS